MLCIVTHYKHVARFPGKPELNDLTVTSFNYETDLPSAVISSMAVW